MQIVNLMKINLRIWRQANGDSPGKLVNYTLERVNPNMSFLEMLDLLNEQLIKSEQSPLEFDNDCREGICGSCGMVINGIAHGKANLTAACQLYMRNFQEGETITVEPWRATAFPVIKDLVVDRSALDRIIAAGGYISVRNGAAPDANSLPVNKADSDRAFEYATCIGCGACVAACPNASASLFTAAKIAHLALLPQGQPERKLRVKKMAEQMAQEGFGDCSNHGECQAVCPQGISLDAIAKMRREYIRSLF